MTASQSVEALLARPFGTVDAMVRCHAAVAPRRTAVVACGEGWDETGLTYGALDRRAERIAAALQRDGIAPGQIVAVAGQLSCDYVALLIGAFRAGVVVAPLASWLDPDAFRAVLADAAPKMLFVDPAVSATTPGGPVRRVALDRDGLGAWIGGELERATPVEVGPDTVDLLLYSSGTTGVPKGVVQRHSGLWALKTNLGVGEGVMLLATPAYATATLVALLSTLTTGGTAVMMKKFDVRRYLELAQEYRATHATLAPVQYQRILADPAFDAFDLSSFGRKISTGAPMAPALKAEVVRRWPGEFWEIYGMSEGGCSCRLEAHLHPDKLHTVGRPSPHCIVKIVDDDGCEAGVGRIGEIVGRSPAMMAGYHGRPQATAEAEWFDGEGRRFVRTGDLGYLDEDGFLVLAGRKRDMIISGGLKIHAVDIERVLEGHPDVDEAAVVAARSETWGETPVAFVVARPGGSLDPDALRQWAGGQVGKVQRLAAVIMVDALPRNPTGKLLKRELRKILPTYA